MKCPFQHTIVHEVWPRTSSIPAPLVSCPLFLPSGRCALSSVLMKKYTRVPVDPRPACALQGLRTEYSFILFSRSRLECLDLVLLWAWELLLASFFFYSFASSRSMSQLILLRGECAPEHRQLRTSHTRLARARSDLWLTGTLSLSVFVFAFSSRCARL